METNTRSNRKLHLEICRELGAIFHTVNELWKITRGTPNPGITLSDVYRVQNLLKELWNKV